MKIFTTQAEVDSALDNNGNLIISDDVKFGFDNAVVKGDISARNILAWNILAWDISYYATCSAYNNILCKSITGRRKNAKHFCLNGKITIKKEAK